MHREFDTRHVGETLLMLLQAVRKNYFCPSGTVLGSNAFLWFMFLEMNLLCRTLPEV